MQPTEVLLRVTDVLEALGITYCVGGSFARTAEHGDPAEQLDRTVPISGIHRSVSFLLSSSFEELRQGGAVWFSILSLRCAYFGCHQCG